MLHPITVNMMSTMLFAAPYDATWGLSALVETDWSIEISAYGSGVATLAELKKLTTTEAAPESVRRHLQSAVVHQGTLFPVVEPATRVLLPLCVANLSLRHSLRPFWEEWLEGVDQVAPCERVPDELLRQTREAIRRAVADDPNDFDCIFEDMDEGAPLTVMMQHANFCANLIRPVVVRLNAAER